MHIRSDWELGSQSLGAFCMPDAFCPSTDPVSKAGQVHHSWEAKVQGSEVAWPSHLTVMLWKPLTWQFPGQGCGVHAGLGAGPGGALHPLSLHLLTMPPVAVSVQPWGPVILQQ